jgi:hypothetical protein
MSEAGEYLIVVKREVFYNEQGQPEPASDVLRVALTLQPVETLPITLDTAVSGTLSDENPSVYYTFTGSEGDRLRLTGSQPADEPPSGCWLFRQLVCLQRRGDKLGTGQFCSRPIGADYERRVHPAGSPRVGEQQRDS